MKKNNLFKSFLIAILAFSIQTSGFSQVLISNSAGSPDGSAMLEIKSTTGGVLIPRMSTADRDKITPVQGLLVYDETVGAFFLYSSSGWVDLSSAEIWTKNGTNVYLSDAGDNVGLGTPTPGSNFVIKGGATDGPDAVLFEIQDNTGAPVFVVTSEGVRIYVKDKAKGVSGGFAVGQYGSLKADGDEFFSVTPFQTKVNTLPPDPAVKGISGGFAVGQYSSLKGGTLSHNFYTNAGETRIYTGGSKLPETKGVSGGFAVGQYGSLKGENDYMHMTPDNYFIGHSAGLNTVLGTLPADSSGRFNIFLGYESGLNNTAGFVNTYIGHNSGKGIASGSTGIKNTFLGFEAGYNITAGSDNVLLGYRAGHEVTTAGNNISIGSDAGYNNKNNSDNIFLGRKAGYNHTGTGAANSANNNIFLGFQAGYGHESMGNRGSDNIFMGTESGKANYLGSLNVFIGNQSGSSNYDGDGNVFLGQYTGAYNTSGDNNTFLGAGSGNLNKSGANNVFIGVQAGQNHDAYTNNVYIGNLAGQGTNNGGNPLITYGRGHDNVFLGTSSGQNITTGFHNVFLGSESGINNTTGYYNVYIGYQAGLENETDDYNTFVGFQSGRDTKNNGFGQNAFFGAYAGAGATSGTRNAFFGYQAGIVAGAGSNNTYIGSFAGGNATGSNNVIIGDHAGYNETGSDKLYIDNSNTTAPLIYGDFSTNLLRVGGTLHIGTAYSLPTSAGTSGEVLVTNGNGTQATWTSASTLYDNDWTVSGNNMHSSVSGNVGIGTSSPSYKLHVVNTGVGILVEGGVSGVFTEGTTFGIYASSSLYAGYFNGDVHVNGTLSKAAGSFKIDHPLDPENKYLYHSFVESPDMMNIYNGNVKLDESGEAIVIMPDYFEALNMEFRYQLTAIGAPGPNLYIKEKIKGNKFVIAGGTINSEVSWQVTGIRQDAFAKKNRIKVEVDKKADEKGKYLHPEAFNQPREKGIDYQMMKK